jgi:hypothetical protein
MARDSNPGPRTALTYEMPFRPALNTDHDHSHAVLRVADARNVRHIGHLLVVAGPSGAGKTTFIRLLANGELPKELQALFSDYRRNWPLSGAGVEEGIRIDKYTQGTSFDGLVLHCDLVRLAKENLAGFDHDTLLRKLMSCATEITVATIKLAPDALASQLLLRQAASHEDRASWINRFWQISRLRIGLLTADAVRRLRQRLAPMLPTNLKRLKPMTRLSGRLDELEQSKFVRKMRKTRESGRLESLYEDWDQFLNSARRTRNIRTVEITQPAMSTRSVLSG